MVAKLKPLTALEAAEFTAKQEYLRVSDIADTSARLHSFNAIKALCEGGLFPGADQPSQSALKVIVGICNREIQRELVKFDKQNGRNHWMELKAKNEQIRSQK